MSRRVLFAIVLVTAACSRRASDAELDAWRDEVNREEALRKRTTVSSEAASWTLAVRGNVETADYTWQQIGEMATHHVKTKSPHHTSDLEAIVDYRGVLVSELLTKLHAREMEGAPGGSQITLVAADGFLTSRPFDIFRHNPVLFAIEENGTPLVKRTGGPLLEVLPHTSHPETYKHSPEGGTYYVTTMIVGTEPLALDVRGKTLGAAELSKLPLHTVEGKHGFRFRWPPTAVKLHGPLLRDVLALARTKPTESDVVRVHRKPKTDTPSREITTLSGKDVLQCDVILGLRYGEDKELLPANLGGPAVLVFPSTCAGASPPQWWPMFVEKLDVVARADGGDGG